MINANELRIGNWVGLSGRKEIVGGIEFKATNDHRNIYLRGNGIWNREDQIDPTPLTPEILIACGFKYGVSEGITSFSDDIDEEKKEGDTHYWDIAIKRTELVDRHNISIVKWGEQEYFTFQLERGSYRQRIKYLHQLQNLYFSLTGKELEIKLLIPTAP